jgi:hypothetical protein
MEGCDMTWHVAAPYILEGIRCCYQCFSVTSATEAQTERIRLQASIHAMELQRDTLTIQAQKDILQALINAQLHIYDRKMDYFQEAFRRFSEQLSQQRQALNEEKKQLEAQLFDRSMPKDQRLFLFKRIGDVA